MVPIAAEFAVAAAIRTKRSMAAAVVGKVILEVVLAKKMLNFLVSSALVAITVTVGHQ